MAWTTPRSWTDTEVVTAAIMTTHVRDNLAYLKAVFDGGENQPIIFAGAVTALSNLSVRSASGGGLEVGYPGVGSGIIDLHHVNGHADYDARLIVASGNAATAGQGALDILAASTTLSGAGTVYGLLTAVNNAIVRGTLTVGNPGSNTGTFNLRHVNGHASYDARLIMNSGNAATAGQGTLDIMANAVRLNSATLARIGTLTYLGTGATWTLTLAFPAKFAIITYLNTSAQWMVYRIGSLTSAVKHVPGGAGPYHVQDNQATIDANGNLALVNGVAGGPNESNQSYYVTYFG